MPKSNSGFSGIVDSLFLNSFLLNFQAFWCKGSILIFIFYLTSTTFFYVKVNVVDMRMLVLFSQNYGEQAQR